MAFSGISKSGLKIKRKTIYFFYLA
jgi:hypothetical protein